MVAHKHKHANKNTHTQKKKIERKARALFPLLNFNIPLSNKA